jgi:hypothetical protein
MPTKDKDFEHRQVTRLELEHVLKRYYDLCKTDDVDFADDIHDLIWDISGGEVNMNTAERQSKIRTLRNNVVATKISEETKKALKGLRLEVGAGRVLVPKGEEDKQWNASANRTITLIDMYIKGKGLLQGSEKGSGL